MDCKRYKVEFQPIPELQVPGKTPRGLKKTPIFLHFFKSQGENTQGPEENTDVTSFKKVTGEKHQHWQRFRNRKSDITADMIASVFAAV
jgi:hypothetical protein